MVEQLIKYGLTKEQKCRILLVVLYKVDVVPGQTQTLSEYVPLSDVALRVEMGKVSKSLKHNHAIILREAKRERCSL